MKMKKRLFAVMMAVVMVLCVFLVSCDNTPKTTGPQQSGKPTQGTAGTTGTSVPTEVPEEKPDIPEGTKFDGETFTVLVWKIASRGNVTDNDDFYDEADEGMEGQAVYDAVKERNRLIEEKYGVTINTIVTSEAVHTVAEKDIKTGTGTYDLIAPMINNIFGLIESQYLVQLETVDTMDLSKTYYDRELFDSIGIDGKNYCFTGDISTMDEELNVCIAYNRTLGTEVGIDPFESVESGKWTFHKMAELARKVTKDLNGDGNWTKEDQYGIGHALSSGFIMFQGGGEKYARLDDNGVPVLTIDGSTRAVETIDKIYEVYNDPEVTGLNEKVYGGVWKNLNDAMTEGKICFRPANIYNLAQYLTMEDEFTVLPVPKLEETQENYHHLVLTNSCAGYCIPTTNDRLEMTGYLIEELSYYGRKIVKPAYYESYVKARLSADQKTAEMFDIIFATKTYDLGYIFNWGGINAQVVAAITSGNFASKIATVKDNAVKLMGETYEKIHNAIG